VTFKGKQILSIMISFTKFCRYVFYLGIITLIMHSISRGEFTLFYFGDLVFASAVTLLLERYYIKDAIEIICQENYLEFILIKGSVVLSLFEIKNIKEEDWLTEKRLIIRCENKEILVRSSVFTDYKLFKEYLIEREILK